MTHDADADDEKEPRADGGATQDDSDEYTYMYDEDIAAPPEAAGELPAVPRSAEGVGTRSSDAWQLIGEINLELLAGSSIVPPESP